MLVHRHKVDNNTEEILAQNEYNELSQLKTKKVGGISPSTPLQSIDYKYNIRGWMTKINDPANLNGKLFGYEMRYNNPNNTSLSTGKYNGNIAEIDWITSKDGILKRYSYQYDQLNRLKKGVYSEPNASIPENNYYNESLSYDLNGNITSLQRNRNAEYIGVQLMDNLSYSYTGNRLNSVTDISGNYFGYPDTSGNQMAYDDNGNMTNHIDKGLLEIKYNYINLPNYIKFNQFVMREDPFGFGSQTIYKNTNYIYRADGIKLKKVHNYFSGRTQADASTTTEYLDGFQYSAEGTGGPFGIVALNLQFVPTAEGYYDFVKSKYIYQYKDQVGNIRLAYYKDASGSPTVDRTTDFYPFGLEFGGGGLNASNSISPNYTYSFQEQEKQQDTGWDSFKWRNYDPTMGRFFNIDPLSEKYAYQSDYNFSENRVIDGKELEGLEWSGIHYKNLDGSQNIQYNVDFKVLNSSTNMTKQDVKIRTAETIKSIEKAYSGIDNEGISISTKVNNVDFVDSVSKGDYYIDFVDKIEGGSSPFTIGKVNNIGDSQSNRVQIISILGSGTGEVAGHEFGHTLGLRHEVDPNNPPNIQKSMKFTNLMNSQSTGLALTPEQLSEIKKNVPITPKVEVENNQFVSPINPD